MLTELRRWPYLIVAAGLAVHALPGTPGDPVLGLLYVGTAAVGLAYAIRAARHPALSPAERRPWRYIAVVFALMTPMAAAFGASRVDGQYTISVGLAVGVLLRLTLTGALVWGLLAFLSEPLSGAARRKLVLDSVTVVGGGLMVLWYVLVAPALRHHHHFDPRTSVAMTFAVVDLVLLLGACLVLMRGSSGVARPLVLLLAGVVVNLVADLVLGFALVHGLREGAVPEAAALANFVAPALMMLAAVERCRVAVLAGRRRRALPRYAALPYLALLLGYALLAVAAVRSGSVVWIGLVVGSVVMTFGVAARQVIALRENHELVVTDSLTRLANRTRLRSSLDRAAARCARTGRRLGVLLIDLDGFKQMNDAFGHEAGDEMLVAFGAALRRSVRPNDLPARLGGDEFAVVLADLTGIHEAVAVAERVLAESGRPVTIAGRTHRIRASVGIAVADPERPVPTNELLHRADQAMYAAKRNQTHGWQLWGVDGAGDDELRADLVVDVEAGQISVVYQPIVDLRSGDLVAVEALARWEHPVRGPVPPSTFIPLAEEAGVVHALGMSVLDQATRQVRRWQQRLPEGRALQLSVNLSAHQLERPALAAEVTEVLARTGFDPRHLVVEIPESAVADDESAAPHLAALRAAGARIALDDFGTGYSSLRHLTRLPVDVLKLDRCFVAELNGEAEGSAVAEAVIRLAQVLRLETIAEGIELPAQATELTLLGCRNAQGYHFAAPLPPERVDELIGASIEAWPHLPPVVPPRVEPLGV
ncbi:hypothetical protein Val02_57490 [Virgisporangium aliadipatigenens]|uniref:Diguanylate cyclase/phosphodiesterase n=1 Tax=Virgisporangium aliadipatigenens TaxID=741659 RepID=A0A8J3YSD0_9ACTN|nr:EAL domain-containing protein [Virgisporangium aliadipatigenens]GIJ48863.1 hypothetical protein Val02_57490 [Virgisporangium aliadipatigenens]